MRQQLSRQAAMLAEALYAGGGMLQTRLRERSTGEIHDLPLGFLRLPGLPLCAAEVFTALQELELRGVVVCSLVVHPWDSSEYTGSAGVSSHFLARRARQ